MVEPFDNSIIKPSESLSPHSGEGIVIDIGTGDGLFVYQCARKNPRKFYIGIDPNPRPLEKVSEKIHRSPRKGGLSNVVFVQAAIEDLPAELDGVADEVHIHFPWGSLLRAMAMGDENVLQVLRRISSSDGLLEVVIALDPERDRSEMERLELKPLSRDYIELELIPRYEAAGFKVLETGILARSEWHKLRTSWAKRLRSSIGRELVYIIAEATSPTS